MVSIFAVIGIIWFLKACFEKPLVVPTIKPSKDTELADLLTKRL